MTIVLAKLLVTFEKELKQNISDRASLSDFTIKEFRTKGE